MSLDKNYDFHTSILCTNVVCFYVVHCNTALANGRIVCDYNAYKEDCWFTCNEGYVPDGAHYRTCLGNGSWSGGNPVCYPRKCSSLPPNSAVQMFETSCVPQYKLGCATECRYGYSGVGGYYTCKLFGTGYGWERAYVKWVGETTCTPGMYLYKCIYTPLSQLLSMMYLYTVQCPPLNEPTNGTLLCSKVDSVKFSYQDNCTHQCDVGYQLTGSVNRTCQGNGSWSGSPANCSIMQCSISSVPSNAVLSESCQSIYQSVCELHCPEGYIDTGNPQYVCEVNDSKSVTWQPARESFKCDQGNSIKISHAIHMYAVSRLCNNCNAGICCL